MRIALTVVISDIGTLSDARPYLLTPERYDKHHYRNFSTGFPLSRWGGGESARVLPVVVIPFVFDDAFFQRTALGELCCGMQNVIRKEGEITIAVTRNTFILKKYFFTYLPFYLSLYSEKNTFVLTIIASNVE